MICINIHKSTIAAFALGFAVGLTRKVYVELKKAEKHESKTEENK